MLYLVVLLYFFAASMFTVSKWGLGFSAPFFFMAARMMLAGSLLLGYLAARSGIHRDFLRSVKRDWFLFAQIIFLHIYLTYVCDLCALKTITSIESAVLYNLSPVVAVMFSYFWFSEYMTLKKWIGLFLGFAAVVPLLLQPGINPVYSHIWPRLLTLIAVVSSTYGWILLRALMKKGYSPIVANGIGMFFGGFIALLTSLATEQWNPTPVVCWLPFMQATMLIVIVENVLFFNLYGYLLKHYTASFLSFAGLICPIMAAALGYFFLGETFSGSLFISFIVGAIGLVMFYHEELKQGYVT